MLLMRVYTLIYIQLYNCIKYIYAFNASIYMLIVLFILDSEKNGRWSSRRRQVDREFAQGKMLHVKANFE